MKNRTLYYHVTIYLAALSCWRLSSNISASFFLTPSQLDISSFLYLSPFRLYHSGIHLSLPFPLSFYLSCSVFNMLQSMKNDTNVDDKVEDKDAIIRHTIFTRYFCLRRVVVFFSCFSPDLFFNFPLISPKHRTHFFRMDNVVRTRLKKFGVNCIETQWILFLLPTPHFATSFKLVNIFAELFAELGLSKTKF